MASPLSADSRPDCPGEFSTLGFAALPLALGLDRLLGDPWHWYHPVQAMGWSIEHGKRLILKTCPKPWQQRSAGGLLTLVVGLGSAAYAWGLVFAAAQVDALLALLVEVVLLASTLGARSLRRAATEVYGPLIEGDLLTARHYLARYVGRDTETLSEPEICRAVIETVAENTPDGGTAPLFYAALGGAPLAFAYKAVSTLDSMLGYRTPPFTYLGTIPAKLEDALTWLPCRLTVLSIAILSGRPWRFWQQCRTQARQDPSPNSGWSEAAYAWYLGLQLGGQNTYRGVVTTKPFLGRPSQPLGAAQIRASTQLLRRVMLFWSVVTVSVRSILIFHLFY